ncbi:MAG: RNA polymerase subunit sigma-70 [Planctomycetaceae bacterium]|nr:RNA polymerase subunit sigma-70 [Planctomycetaceae bacterium]MAT10205.1 RNA polymerase subunit sigma-70 [Rhodopirellula sp.]
MPLRHQTSTATVSQDEHDLIRSILAGSSEAFERLISPYSDRLFNTLAHILRNAEAAEDVLQDALLQAFVKLNTYQGKSSFYTWLYRIAVNLAFSYRRRERPTISMDSQKREHGEEPHSTLEAVDAESLRMERAEILHLAIGELTEEFRTVIILREIEGCDYETIGDILAISPGTVRSRIHRGRLQLREKLIPLFKQNSPAT